ncbi:MULTISPECIES: periplasmic nitrate reductase, NapE protein [Vreelandella]|uniref:Nitrate reductase n=2 Tax=Vreelandella TaxID=3137766 RepID=A0A7C9NPE4_9GAMM|nr:MULTISPECIES: periplasmic nitrate reductase, NapE protein [Halomonas]NDL70128.1 nitrate reductase [Halomonas alkaliphila]NYS44452.1 periplasmic nitrate reductase, NapE protein [Halomonas zhaodongensis]
MLKKSHPTAVEKAPRKRQELGLFLFIVVLLFPILAVAVVGGYGFSVWIFQMFTGPPGSPL